MSLNSLTLRAKKSVSTLFAIGQLDTAPCTLIENAQEAQRDKQNDVTNLEDFGCHVQHKETHSHDNKTASPGKSPSSRRKRLMGSLRRISSLRSVHSSPSRCKERDGSPPPPPLETTRTPTRYLRHSLALNFIESPPGQPIFDFSEPRRSVSSSVVVRHSSPVTVPSSQRENSSSAPVDPAILPAGTIPTTPGPFQKALERDAASKTPSPVLSPAFERDGTFENIPTPMPGTNLAFEDIHPDIVIGPSSTRPVREPSGYFRIVVDDCHESIKFDKSQYDNETVSHASAEALEEIVQHLNTTCEAQDDESKPTLREENSPKCQRADRTESEHSVADSTDGPSEEAHMEGIEHVVWEDEDTEIVTAYAPTPDDMPVVHCAKNSKAKSQNRVQEWPTHSGLYDGSGYGGETDSTASRPSTSTYETVETTPTSDDTTSLGPTKRRIFSATDTAGDSHRASLDMSTDQETLEEVIRAYAVYDESEATYTTDSDISDDVDLGNKLSDQRLGA